jgi:hypothetical protein
MNPAYKHLSDRMRIAELTIPQIVGLSCGFLCGLVFALYVSPFGAYPTLFLSIYIATIPAGAVLLASTTEFDVWLFLRACVRDRLSEGRYVPGPGPDGEGYVIEGDHDGQRRGVDEDTQARDLEAIWDF